MDEQAFPITPMGDRIFVKRLENKKMAGMIHIPDQAKEKPLFGQVIACGPGVTDSDINDDAIVLYGKYAGFEINVLGTDYLLLREEEVLGVVGEEMAKQMLEQGV